MRTILKLLKRWLYIGHRWLGIVTCLMFVIWFISGLVMMYVSFPKLTDVERRAAMPAIAWDKVAVTSYDALATAGVNRFPRDLRLEMLGAEPVYRVTDWDGSRRTVSAESGTLVGSVDAQRAIAVAGTHPAAVDVVLLDGVERDQWSVTARYDPLRPFHLVSLGDSAGTELYISTRTGEIALDTTRHERIWNWFGAIPHWIYLTPLRADAALWRDVVLWVSGVGIVVAVSGFWIGILRVRLRRRYRAGAITPYRGWAGWHHVGGFIGGLTLVTFVISGWLSMNPNHWFSSRNPSPEMLQRYAGQDAPRTGFDFDRLRVAVQPGSVEARFLWVGAQPYVVSVDGRSQTVVCCRDDNLAGPLPQDEIAAAARTLVTDGRVIAHKRLEQEDAYWYGHHQERRLPVLRVIFDDPVETWVYIDPATGDIVGRLDRSARAYRWLFNAPHSFDFRVLLQNRPAWDLVVWTLSLAGLVISLSGTVIGWRRLRRSGFHQSLPAAPVPTADAPAPTAVRGAFRAPSWCPNSSPRSLTDRLTRFQPSSRARTARSKQRPEYPPR